VIFIEKLNEIQLIDRAYIERFKIIYEIWILIDNDLNSREQNHLPIIHKKSNQTQTEKVSWNFIGECKKYEKIFGAFTNNVK
jgi:hypothetical protein